MLRTDWPTTHDAEAVGEGVLLAVVLGVTVLLAITDELKVRDDEVLGEAILLAVTEALKLVDALADRLGSNDALADADALGVVEGVGVCPIHELP